MALGDTLGTEGQSSLCHLLPISPPGEEEAAEQPGEGTAVPWQQPPGQPPALLPLGYVQGGTLTPCHLVSLPLGGWGNSSWGVLGCDHLGMKEPAGKVERDFI